MVDDPTCGGRAAWRRIGDANVVVRKGRVGDGETYRTGRWLDQDAVAGGAEPIGGEILHHTVSNGEATAGVQDNAVGAAGGAGPIDRYAVYADAVARAGIDGDCVSIIRWRNRSPTVTFDANRVRNGQRAVVGRIEHKYFTAWAVTA
jgi:hypothetical protein